MGAIAEEISPMPTKPSPFVAAATLALISVTAPAFAQAVNYQAELTGAAEVPPNLSPGTGSVVATYDPETRIFKWTIEYADLTGPATAAHFHGPADPGASAPPVVPIEGDLASPISGEVTLTEEQVGELQTGKWYINIHTAQYPDGELRAQLPLTTHLAP
jgi:hypothetical protein